MNNRLIISAVLVLTLWIASSGLFANSLDDKIRASESDLKVFCLATSIEQIQWSALLYLNQNFGAEIFIGILQTAPEFGCISYSSKNGQFHYLPIGRPSGMSDETLADSMVTCMFNGGYPDIALVSPSSPADSSLLTSVLQAMQTASMRDVITLTNLERIFIQGKSGTAADVILNDAEIYQQLKSIADEIAVELPILGEIVYQPQRFRWYYRLDKNGSSGKSDFLSGIDRFRLPEIISDLVNDGPEQKNLLNRLNRFRSYIRASYSPRLGPSEKLRLLLSAYAEITRLEQMIQAGTGNLAGTRVLYRAQMVRYKTSLAVSEAVGVDWTGRLILRDTPFGKSGKLQLELDLSGPLPVELSYFKFHPAAGQAVIIDSISTVVQPHQKLYREYPIELDSIKFDDARADSALFSIELVIEGLSMDLFISYADYGDEDVSITWLPGYAILSPFRDGDITSLAQTFDWQIKITKPYNSEFKARLLIDNPDVVVVGSYRKDIVIPEGVTTKYIDIHLAAGRSIEYNKEKITARLMSGGKLLASTSANVRIVRSSVPDTRDIAFIPDKTGKLEDFLRMAKVSFKPFTAHSLTRATLDAYDLLIIGEDASDYYGILRSVNSRLRKFVRNGGDILILGQSFGWPPDIFEFPIYTSQNSRLFSPVVKAAKHRILTSPFTIQTGQLFSEMKGHYSGWSAIMEDGSEIISAGEHGSYLRVSTVGDGRIIYCGLPLLDMAGKLNVEAIHLLANLLNFGHGNK
ncbi:MAG: hypothetical protein KAR42_16640 [candidate division Zixibacteria bacterium]|nr:hypothetical protein [candidate division Zixibacteria bacterium]